MIRQFGVFANGNNGGSLNQTIFDYYTPYIGKWEDHHCNYYDDQNNRVKSVSFGMGDSEGTNYDKFNACCSQSMTPEMKEDMLKLLKKTPFINHPEELLTIAQKENKRCYDELYDKVEKLKTAKRNKRKRL